MATPSSVPIWDNPDGIWPVPAGPRLEVDCEGYLMKPRLSYLLEDRGLEDATLIGRESRAEPGEAALLPAEGGLL